MNNNSTNANSTAPRPSGTTPKRTKKGTKKGQRTFKEKFVAAATKDTFINPPTPLGCVWRSAVLTIILLAIYLVVGYLLTNNI